MSKVGQTCAACAKDLSASSTKLACKKCTQLNLAPTFFCDDVCRMAAWAEHTKWHKEQKKLDAYHVDLFSSDNATEAKRTRQLARLTGETWSHLLAEGLQQMQEANYLEAMKLFEQGISVRPREQLFYYNMAVCYERSNDQSKAGALFFQAADRCNVGTKDWADAFSAGVDSYCHPSCTAPKPEWWTDKKLKSLSKKAVEARPQAFEIWKMRATVLTTMDLGSRFDVGSTGAVDALPRTAAEMREAAECWQKAARLRPQGDSSAALERRVFIENGVACRTQAEWAGGEFVVLRGLEKCAELNGQQAKTVSFSLATKRWGVKLRVSGRVVHVKPQHLRKGLSDGDVREAIHDNVVEAVRKWLEKGDIEAVSPFDRQERHSREHTVQMSLLQLAAIEGHAAIVELLLSKGADPNKVLFDSTKLEEGQYEHTPLGFLLIGKDKETDYTDDKVNERVRCVKLLLDAGAQVIDVRFPSRRKGKDGRFTIQRCTALEYTLEHVPLPASTSVLVVVNSTRECAEVVTLLLQSIIRTSTEKAKEFVNTTNVNFNPRQTADPPLISPLWYSVALYASSDSDAERSGWLSTCTELLGSGADVNFIETVFEETPLHFLCSGPAVSGGELLVLLLRHRADVNSFCGLANGCVTPLMEACRCGSEAYMLTLLEHGADVNAEVPTVDGRSDLYRPGHTALHCAVHTEQYSLEAMRILLDNGAHINARSARLPSSTPLFIAASHGKLDAVSLLLERKADPNIGMAMMMTSVSGDDSILLSMCRDFGVTPDDNLEFTPLCVAAQEGHLEIAELLLENGARVDAERGHDSALDVAYYRGGADSKLYKLLEQKHIELNLSTARYTVGVGNNSDMWAEKRSQAAKARHHDKLMKSAQFQQDQAKRREELRERFQREEQERHRVQQAAAAAAAAGSSVASANVSRVLGHCGAGSACLLGEGKLEIRSTNEPIATSCSRGCRRLWHKRCWRSALAGGNGCQIGRSRCPCNGCSGLLKWRGRYTDDLGEWDTEAPVDVGDGGGPSSSLTCASSNGEIEPAATEQHAEAEAGTAEDDQAGELDVREPEAAEEQTEAAQGRDSADALDGVLDRFGHLIVGELDPTQADPPAAAAVAEEAGLASEPVDEPVDEDAELRETIARAEASMARDLDSGPSAHAWRQQVEANLQTARDAWQPAPPPRLLGECCICLEELFDVEAVWLACAHSFHRKCIETWQQNAQRCPECCYTTDDQSADP